MTLVKIEDVVKFYGKTKALKGVSAEIKEGETYGLLGLNGAGKTTLISIISGLLKADGGDVYVDGLSVTSRADDVKKLIAVSPQETAVAPNLTVKENLEFFAELYGKPKYRAIIAIDEFRLTEVADKRAKALSGGYARRLSVAAALITEPKVLILDEPTLGLDVVARRELWKILGGAWMPLDIMGGFEKFCEFLPFYPSVKIGRAITGALHSVSDYATNYREAYAFDTTTRLGFLTVFLYAVVFAAFSFFSFSKRK